MKSTSRLAHCNHGWLLAYDKTSLQQKAIFNDTPDGAGGGLWNSGGAPAIDDQSGKGFIMTGVDQNDPPAGTTIPSSVYRPASSRWKIPSSRITPLTSLSTMRIWEAALLS
jgi:hypothetical protein